MFTRAQWHDHNANSPDRLTWDEFVEWSQARQFAEGGSEWVQFTTRNDTIAWRNSSTGERRYQSEKPGGGGDGESKAEKKLKAEHGPGEWEGSPEAVERAKDQLKQGLESWVENYNDTQGFGNVKLAKQIRHDIEEQIKTHKLDSATVYNSDERKEQPAGDGEGEEETGEESEDATQKAFDALKSGESIKVETEEGKRFTIEPRHGGGANGYGIIPEGKKRVLSSRGHTLMSDSRLKEWLSRLRPVGET